MTSLDERGRSGETKASISPDYERLIAVMVLASIVDRNKGDKRPLKISLLWATAETISLFISKVITVGGYKHGYDPKSKVLTVG